MLVITRAEERSRIEVLLKRKDIVAVEVESSGPNENWWRVDEGYRKQIRDWFANDDGVLWFLRKDRVMFEMNLLGALRDAWVDVVGWVLSIVARLVPLAIDYRRTSLAPWWLPSVSWWRTTIGRIWAVKRRSNDVCLGRNRKPLDRVRRRGVAVFTGRTGNVSGTWPPRNGWPPRKPANRRKPRSMGNRSGAFCCLQGRLPVGCRGSRPHPGAIPFT